MKFTRLLALIIISGLTILAGCQASTGQPAISTAASTIISTSLSVSYVDDLGRNVQIKGIPQRIVSLAPSNTEILYALGLGDKVVGVTDYDNYPPEVKSKTVIGGFSDPDIEKVVSVAPDLILAANLHEQEVIPQLEKRGLTVLALNPQTLEGISKSVMLVGKVAGKEAEAIKLLADMDKRTKAVRDATASLKPEGRPRVLYVTWHDPIWTAGSATLFNDLIYQAGGTNIAADLKGYATISLESVIQRNPQVIVVMSSMGERSTSFEYTKNEPRFQATDALKNGQIFSIDADIFGRTTPRIVDGLEQLARMMHPEIFK